MRDLEKSFADCLERECENWILTFDGLFLRALFSSVPLLFYFEKSFKGKRERETEQMLNLLSSYPVSSSSDQSRRPTLRRREKKKGGKKKKRGRSNFEPMGRDVRHSLHSCLVKLLMNTTFPCTGTSVAVHSRGRKQRCKNQRQCEKKTLSGENSFIELCL